MLISSSTTHGLFTWPLIWNSFVPRLFSTPQDRRRNRDRLDVVDRRRAAIKAGTRRERWLQPRLALLPLEALQHRGLFAADVSASATVHEHVEVVARPACVLADEAAIIGLGDRREQRLGLADIFATDVDVGGACAHREPGDQRALDQLVRIVADDLAILAAARLGFIGVYDKEVRPIGLRLLGHERPFGAGREPCPAAATQTRRLHHVDDRVLAERHQILGVVPIAAHDSRVDIPRLETVDVGKDAVLIGEHQAHSPR
jgi:hypothetical protein